MKVTAVGMVWYKREDYQKFLSILDDAQKLPPSFDEWLKSAEKGFQHLKAQGREVEKVHLDSDTFPEWCKSRGVIPDANARMLYANGFVAEKYLRK